MTIGQPTEPPKKLSLQEQLAKLREQNRKVEAPKIESLPTPTKVELQTDDKLDDKPEISNDQKLKDFKAKMELESLEAGYKSLKEREQALKDGEKEFTAGCEQLAKEREVFEKDQRERVGAYNLNIKNYNEKYELLKTTQKEADKHMQEALQAKSQANAIIKAQKESEKETQEKLEAYDTHMAECIEVFEEITGILMKQRNINCSQLGGILNHDVALIQRMQTRNSSMSSIAELIGADIDRIIELAEILQDSKSDYGKLLNYLMTNTDFLTKCLKIDWQANTKEGSLI